MNDWVKIAVVIAVVLAMLRVVNQQGEKFVSNVTTGTATPSFGTPLADAAGLPLTDALPTPTSCSIQPNSIDTDLLPKPQAQADDFSYAPNPSALANQSYLEPAKYIGMDTTMGTKRNSSYDIRSNIPIPACPGAWGNVYQSTIMPDPWRKDICTGAITSPAPVVQTV